MSSGLTIIEDKGKQKSYRLAIHERERDEERRRRARVTRQASNSSDIPLFEEPRRVQPSTEDALQQRIQATLGKFDTIAPSVFQHQSHLFGIPRLPQTPIEGDQKFIFDAKSKDSKNFSELKKAQMISSYQATLKKTLNNIKVKDEVNGLKTQKVNGVVIGSGQISTAKSPLLIKSQDTITPSKHSTLSQSKSPPISDTNPSTKKTEAKPVVNGVLSKSRQEDDKRKERPKVKVKMEKDGRVRKKSESENSESGKGQTHKSNATSKSKPPKIRLPERSLPTTSEEQENRSVDEPNNVEKIIAEMQQVAPPLTGIHTPIKGGNSIFAFGHRNITQENSVPPVMTTKRKLSESVEVKKENGNGEVLLNDDLMLTDESDDEHDHQPSSPSKNSKNVRHRSHSTSSSGSSSDDSDSDSSDSDSDSSSSDTNNNTKDKSVKSPMQSPSSPTKPASGRKWNLTDFMKALNQSSTPPKTKPSPSAANVVGEDGVRGNQVAPAVNSNKSSLNSHVSNQTNAVSKQIKSPVAPAPVDLVPFAADLCSNSPEMDQGFNIESLTAKLDLPLEADTATNPSKPVSNDAGQNSVTAKIQVPKVNKKADRKSSVLGPKLNSGKEKSQSEKLPSPKKPVKTSKKVTKTPNNSTSAKVSNGISESVNKASKTTKAGNGAAGVKSTKKKAETKSKGAVVIKQEPVDQKHVKQEHVDQKHVKQEPVDEKHVKQEPVDEKHVKQEPVDVKQEPVDAEDVFVDIVSVENSPVKPDSKPASAAKAKETEKPKVTKSKPVVTNGLSKPVNGEKLFTSLISPSRTKDILGKNVEITYDEVNRPESLIVKIDLSLLKRIPKLPGNELIKQEHTASLPVSETNGIKDAISSPEVKIPKRKSSDATTEREMPKKVKSDSDVESSQTKPRERSSSSSSSTISGNKKGSHRKRSPSQDKDSYRSKRQRHDSENNKVQENSMQGCQNDRLAENGVDATDNSLKPHECSCSGKSNNDKREADILRFYDPEPRVPYGPDHYLAEAKKLKHKADSSSDKEAKAFFYIEAVMFFARCGKAIEQNEDSESRSAFQMYSETLDLLRYTMRNFVNRYTHRSHNVPDKRLSALCMRIQSILYMRLYKLKKDHIMRNVKMVTEHFRGPPKSTQAPSPYTSNTKITGTPSPLSPTPSPSGSVGSVGSNGSNETVTTPSRNGKPSSASSAMTSPVNVCIPQKIHSMTQQHVLQSNNLVYSQDTWEQAQPVVLEFKDFFMDLDRTCGPLTLQSSIVHLIEYIEEGVKCIRDALKANKS